MPTYLIPPHRFSRGCRSPSARRKARGVLLIEVLVSILIFSFGVLGTVALYARAVQYSTNAEDRSRAALLANEMATAMWLRGTNNVANASLKNEFDAWKGRVGEAAGVGVGAGLPSGEGTVSAVVLGTATITVTWKPTFGNGAVQKFVTQVTM